MTMRLVLRRVKLCTSVCWELRAPLQAPPLCPSMGVYSGTMRSLGQRLLAMRRLAALRFLSHTSSLSSFELCATILATSLPLPHVVHTWQPASHATPPLQ